MPRTNKRSAAIAAVLIILSVMAEPFAVASAYTARGRFAIGGEWLIVPLGILLAVWENEISRALSEWKERERRRREQKKVAGGISHEREPR